MHALISLRCWCNIQIFCISIRLQCWLNTVHLALFLGSISPHVNCFFHTASDEKLGRAWERGYYSSFTYMWIAYKLYSHANSANWGTWIRLVYNIYQNTSCKWRARLHTYIHTYPPTYLRYCRCSTCIGHFPMLKSNSRDLLQKHTIFVPTPTPCKTRDSIGIHFACWTIRISKFQIYRLSI